MRSMEEMVKLVCNYLNDTSAEYVLVGGIAVIAYGTPRTTMDADFIIQMEIEELRKLTDFLQSNGFFSDPEEAEILMQEKSHFSAIDKDSLLRLDIKGVYNEMDRRTLENRRDINYHGIQITRSPQHFCCLICIGIWHQTRCMSQQVPDSSISFGFSVFINIR